MAHIQMWVQGEQSLVSLDCGEIYKFSCPKSKRTAIEYDRGYFTHTAVLSPNQVYDQRGQESQVWRMLQEAKVGDYLWLVLVPPMHKIDDVFAYNDTLMMENSSLASFGGISVSLVTGKFKAPDADKNCPMAGEESHGTLAFPEHTVATPAKAQFLSKDVTMVNDLETWTGVGLKIDALPKDGALANITGRLVVGAHTRDYEGQITLL